MPPILRPSEFGRKQGIFFLVPDEFIRIHDPLNLEAHESVHFHPVHTYLSRIFYQLKHTPQMRRP